MTTPTKAEVLESSEWLGAYAIEAPLLNHERDVVRGITQMLRAYAAMLEPVSDEEVRSAAKVADDFRLEHPTGEFLSCSEAAEADMRAALESFLAGRMK